MPSNVPLSFRDLLVGCTQSAVHLEMRDAYAVDYETGPFADWRAGHRYDPADRASWWRPWLDLVAGVFPHVSAMTDRASASGASTVSPQRSLVETQSAA